MKKTIVDELRLMYEVELAHSQKLNIKHIVHCRECIAEIICYYSIHPLAVTATVATAKKRVQKK